MIDREVRMNKMWSQEDEDDDDDDEEMFGSQEVEKPNEKKKT